MTAVDLLKEEADNPPFDGDLFHVVLSQLPAYTYPFASAFHRPARLSPPQPCGAGWRSICAGKSRSHAGRSVEGAPRSVGSTPSGAEPSHAAAAHSAKARQRLRAITA